MSKDIKNDMTPDPEDPTRDIPRGAPSDEGEKKEKMPPNRQESEGGAADEWRLRFEPASDAAKPDQARKK